MPLPQKMQERMFKPGQSGNPHGRPRVNPRVIELARQHTERAIIAIAEALEATRSYATKHDVVTVPDYATRAYAGQLLLDRGWGKPCTIVEMAKLDPEHEQINQPIPTKDLTDDQLSRMLKIARENLP